MLGRSSNPFCLGLRGLLRFNPSNLDSRRSKKLDKLVNGQTIEKFGDHDRIDRIEAFGEMLAVQQNGRLETAMTTF